MNIKLIDVGKRFNDEWIFQHLNYEFGNNKKYAVTGPNGSGKSTLLQIIGGFIHHSRGTITYENSGALIAPEKIAEYCSLSAPYLDVIEEMTLKEFLVFHQKMKGFQQGLTIAHITEKISLDHAKNKQIRYFSSGMKQRVKLAQAFLSDTPLLLLDEPLSNLDEEGVGTYYNLINEYTRDRTVVICSNDEKEYGFCDQIINLMEFK